MDQLVRIINLDRLTCDELELTHFTLYFIRFVNHRLKVSIILKNLFLFFLVSLSKALAG